MNTIIALKNVTKTYKLGKTTVEALRGVNLELERGGTYAIVGPSGSGKSTLLHIAGCMDTPSSGEVWVNGRDVSRLSEKALTQVRAHDIGFVFQAFHLNPILTARENVAIALQFLGTGKKAALARADEWLARVGLAERARHYPAELSGGERQRVAIARALVKRPALLLADEPTGNLDTERGKEIVGLLREISQQQNTTIVLVTHNAEVAEMSDYVLGLRDGKVVEQRATL